MERTTHKDLKKIIEDNSDIPGRVTNLETRVERVTRQIGEVHDGVDFTMASFEELNKTFTQSAERTTEDAEFTLSKLIVSVILFVKTIF